MSNVWLSGFSTTPPPPPVVLVRPLSDTIRGGRLILVTSALPLDGGGLLDAPMTVLAGLPNTWTPVLTGSAITAPEQNGVLLSTGLTAASTATVVTDQATLEWFDLALDFEVLQPIAPLSYIVEALSLELVTPAGDVASLKVRIVGGQAGVAFDYVPFGAAPQAGGHIMVAPPFSGTLRFVRNEEFLWAFFGTRDIRFGADAYDPDELVGVGYIANFATGPITPQFAVRNNVVGAGELVSTLVRNYTVRGHATINGRLLDDKKLVYGRQVLGKVPQASLADVGFSDVVVFGPGGSAVAPLAFNYTLPDVLTLSAGGTVPLSTATDPALFDGPGRTKRRGGR